MSSHSDFIDIRTHGSDQRPPRPLHEDLQSIDVAALAAELRAEDAFASDGRSSKTIHDDGQTRVIVSAVAHGRVIGADSNDEHVMLSLAHGEGSLRRAETTTPLVSGGVAIISPGSPWTFRADTDSAFTATFWSSTPSDA